MGVNLVDALCTWQTRYLVVHYYRVAVSRSVGVRRELIEAKSSMRPTSLMRFV